MTTELDWLFPEDGADQWNGFNDSGIEHFRGNPFGNLAREVIQNSLDAFVAFPITVSFLLQQIPRAEIPGIDQLTKIINFCLTSADTGGKKASDFLTAAKKIASGKTIPVLTISEHNTTGMTGPCKNGTPYYAYMKATDQSQKEVGKLGSY
jgi:hypothetical protein